LICEIAAVRNKFTQCLPFFVRSLFLRRVGQYLLEERLPPGRIFSPPDLLDEIVPPNSVLGRETWDGGCAELGLQFLPFVGAGGSHAGCRSRKTAGQQSAVEIAGSRARLLK